VHAKVLNLRHTDGGKQVPWSDGPPTSDIDSIAAHWADQYNWTTEQAILNNHPNFMTTMPITSDGRNDSTDIFFVHQRSHRQVLRASAQAQTRRHPITRDARLAVHKP
jgi:hypothetical protein